MHIINRTEIEGATVRNIAQQASVLGLAFVLFLDNELNAVRADAARKNLQEHPNWQYLRPRWEQEATGENDIHACTVDRRTIPNQQLPKYVIDAIGGHELLVYLDATYTTGEDARTSARCTKEEQSMRLSLTLSHELRHAWQFFNAPVVFHSQTALSWVHPPQETPCELDAEKAAKRTLHETYGDMSTRAYLQEELRRCKPQHREVLQRFAALDPAADPDMEKKTIALLEQYAAEIRRCQVECRSTVPAYVMPGVPQLMESLRGKSSVRLLP